MNCKNAKEAICSYLDDLLDPKEQTELNEHLESCSDCASYLEDLREGLRMLHELPLEEPSENFEWNLKRKINEAVTERTVLSRHREKSSFWPRFAASAAAALIVALCGAWFWYAGLMDEIPEGPVAVPGGIGEVAHEEFAQPSATAPANEGGHLGPVSRGFDVVGNQVFDNSIYQGPPTIQPAELRDMEPFMGESARDDSLKSEPE